MGCAHPRNYVILVHNRRNTCLFVYINYMECHYVYILSVRHLLLIIILIMQSNILVLMVSNELGQALLSVCPVHPV